MLRLPAFRYVAPRTLYEAAEHLAEDGPDAAAVAGGTDLLPHMKRRQRTPSVLVGLRHLKELHGIRSTPDGGLAIGAGCTLAEVSQHPALAARYPALTRAAELVATPTVRQMGTIGGNLCIDTRCTCFNLPLLTRTAQGLCLKDGGPICVVAPRSPRCWAVASSDTAPLLIALGARVHLMSITGERTIPLAELYCDDGLHPLSLRHGEVLTEILLPPADGTRAVYKKVRRRGTIDFPVLGVAVAVRGAPADPVADARIVLGAVASTPIVAADAARLLMGSHLDPEVAAAAAVAAAGAAKPLENTDFTAGWRKHMVRVTVERAIREVAGLGETA